MQLSVLQAPDAVAVTSRVDKQQLETARLCADAGRCGGESERARGVSSRRARLLRRVKYRSSAVLAFARASNDQGRAVGVRWALKGEESDAPSRGDDDEMMS
jgi:phosphate/sulfate permease